MAKLTKKKLQDIKTILEREGLTSCAIQRELIFVEHNVDDHQKMADLCVQILVQMMLGAHIGSDRVNRALRKAIRGEKKRA